MIAATAATTARWDRRRYNGYSYRGRWYYGPPPVAYRDYVDYGYRAWRRGDRLPRYYRDNYVVVPTITATACAVRRAATTMSATTAATIFSSASRPA